MTQVLHFQGHDGLDLRAAASGPASGVPVLLVHGGGQTRRAWRRAAEVIAAQGYRAIALDLRGHGESDAPLWRYTLDQAANDVIGLLDHLAIRRATFVGLSMGGYILFALYRLYPDRVQGLVLANTRAQADSVEGKDGRFQMAQTAYKKGPSAIADIMIPKLVSPATVQTKPELVRRVRAMIEENQISGIAGDLMAMADRPDSIPLLNQITCPTHIIGGELDIATPPSDAKLMAERIPDASLTIIPGAAHLSNLEQPHRFIETVHTFVSTVTHAGSR